MSEKTSKGTQRIDELYIIGVDGSVVLCQDLVQIKMRGSTG